MKKISKYLVEFFVVCSALYLLENTEGAMPIVFLVMVALIAWVLIVDRPARKRKKSSAASRQARPAKRQSFRSRVVSSTSDSVSRGIASVLIPRKPMAQELERERQRAQAKKDFTFHSAQAKRYEGTLDGEYHKNMARQARDRMK